MKAVDSLSPEPEKIAVEQAAGLHRWDGACDPEWRAVDYCHYPGSNTSHLAHIYKRPGWQRDGRGEYPHKRIWHSLCGEYVVEQWWHGQRDAPRCSACLAADYARVMTQRDEAIVEVERLRTIVSAGRRCECGDDDTCALVAEVERLREAIVEHHKGCRFDQGWAKAARAVEEAERQRDDALDEVGRLLGLLAHPTTLTALRAAYKSPSALGLGDDSDGWKLYQAALACQPEPTN